MTILDLGVENVGEFYAEHYLSSVLDADLSGVYASWERGEREGKATPWAALRQLQRPFEALRARAGELTDEVARWRETHAFHVRLLQSLGYAPARAAEPLDDKLVLPALVSLSREGKPWLLVLEAPIAPADAGDAMDARPLAAQLPDDAQSLALPERSWREIVDEDLFARDTPDPPRWLLFLGGDEATLIDRWKWPQGACLRFDLGRLLTVRTEEGLRALTALLHRESLAPAEGAPLHDTLDENSHKHAHAASEDLKHGARRAVEILGNEVVFQIRRAKEGVFNDPALAAEVTRDCLVYLYRLLFLFYVEARGAELGVVPANAEAYRRGYGLEALRDLELVPLDTESARNGTYIHQSLQRLFTLVNEGFPRYRERLELARSEGAIRYGFTVPGLRSALFDAERTRHIDRYPLRNQCLQAVIACLSLTREVRGKERARISYAQLGINQLGAVYEGLLSYSGFFATTELYEVRAADAQNDPEARTWFVPAAEVRRFDEKTEVVRNAEGEPVVHPRGTYLYRLAGRDREKTASYYTPEVLTRCLTKYTLKERLAGLSSAEILGLTVCEPAMGSGAFLNEAVTQLANAWLERRQEELGKRIPSSEIEAERQRARFHFATARVYGVDLNPMAAELGKVSLWLNVLGRELPSPWFDARIATGNSLLGARREVFSLEDLRAPKGKKSGPWLEKVPQRVPVGSARPDGTVWHFLVPDAGMCPFDQDKVVKSLAPEAVAAIKAWRKAQCLPFELIDETRVKRLSDRVDALFERHRADRDELLAHTRQSLRLLGDEGEAPRTPNLRECEEWHRRFHEDDRAMVPLRAVMDYWCALWFWPVARAKDLPSREDWLGDLEAILRLRAGAPDATRMEVVRTVAARVRFFHWELAFPEVFARGGFDVILGNPPWLKVEWKDSLLLSEFDPQIELRSLSATAVNSLRGPLIANEPARSTYISEYELTAGTQKFLSSHSNFTSLVGMQCNLYKCFIIKSWSILQPSGYVGLIHQNGIIEDPDGASLRDGFYRRLRSLSGFRNVLKLFSEVGHKRTFCMSISAGAPSESISFRMCAELFHPRTLEDSESHSGIGEVPGIKTPDGKWNLAGHRDRIVTVDSERIRQLSRLFDRSEEADNLRIPWLYSEGQVRFLAHLASHPNQLGDDPTASFSTLCFNETGAQEAGTIIPAVDEPKSPSDWVVSGPHFYICTPLAKSARKGHETKGDFDPIDLEVISDDYVPRAVFSPGHPNAEFRRRLPTWNNKSTVDFYRYASRRMVDPSGERTLIPALLPPGPSHIHTVVSVAFRNVAALTGWVGLLSSIVVDSVIRSTGRMDVSTGVLSTLPIIANPHPYLIARVLRLNCVTVHYADLWTELFPLLRPDDGFTREDPRLPRWALTPRWHRDVALRRAFARRQALVEIDALAALALGISMDDLALVYRVQFPVLQEYERDTWYDREGRIVFTVNKGLPGVGLARAEWEKVREAKAGDAMPEFAAKYVPPFDRCDRERDMREAYRVFQERVKTLRSDSHAEAEGTF